MPKNNIQNIVDYLNYIFDALKPIKYDEFNKKFEFKELIPILKLSSFPSIRTSKYIVTIAGKPKLATNCIKSSSNDIFLQIIFNIAKKAPQKLKKGISMFEQRICMSVCDIHIVGDTKFHVLRYY